MNAMKIAWSLKKEKGISLSQALKEAWNIVKEENKISLDEQQYACKKEEPEPEPERKLIKNNRITHIIYNNAIFYIENNVDKKYYVKNGVSYIETTPEYYKYLKLSLEDRKACLRNVIKMCGRDSKITGGEIFEYKLWVKSFNKVKVV